MSENPTTTEPATEPTGPPTPPDAKFTQADVDRIVQDRLARKDKDLAEKSEKARQESEAQRLRDEAKWQDLAAQHETRVKALEPELETLKSRHTALAEQVSKEIDAGMKNWPTEAKKLVPETEDIAARRTAYDSVRALLENGSLAGRTPGNPPSPRPAGGDAGPDTETVLRRTGRYDAI